MHHHKTRKLKISAEEIHMPPKARTLSLTSWSKEGCKFVPISVSKQKKVTSPARPCHTEDVATAEGTPRIHWGVKSGLGLFVSYYHKRMRGNSDITTQ